MQTVLIVHGAEGFPEENWFPWLKTELETLGHNVIVPQFPTPEHQTLERWMEVFNTYQQELPVDSIVVGHSLGVPFLLNVLEKHPMAAAFFVAGFVGEAGNDYDEGMKTFAQRRFDWDAIKRNCERFTIFHADNDPYIRLEKAQELGRLLDTPVTIIPGAGHFNSAFGYTRFDQLLQAIRKNF